MMGGESVSFCRRLSWRVKRGPRTPAEFACESRWFFARVSREVLKAKEKRGCPQWRSKRKKRRGSGGEEGGERRRGQSGEA